MAPPDAAAPMRHPVAPKRSPSAVTTTAAGLAVAIAIASSMPATRTAPESSTSRRRATSSRSDVTCGRIASAPADGRHRRRRRRGGGAEREHGAARVVASERAHRPRGVLGVVDHDAGERLAERRLDGRFPPRRRCGQVEQRAEHPVEAGHAVGAGPGVGQVERQLQRLDARGRVRHVFGARGAVGDRRVEGAAGVGRAQLGPFDVVDERALEQLGRRAVVARLVADALELEHPGGELVAPIPGAVQLGLGAVGRRATGAQLAAHLGDGAGRRGGGRRVERGELLGPLVLEGLLLDLQRRSLGGVGGLGGLDVVELGAVARGVGLDDATTPASSRCSRSRAIAAVRSAMTASSPRARSTSWSARARRSPTSSAPRAVSSAPSATTSASRRGQLRLERGLGLRGARCARRRGG